MALINPPRLPISTITSTNYITTVDVLNIKEDSSPAKVNVLINDLLPTIPNSSALVNYEIVGIKVLGGKSLTKPMTRLDGKYGYAVISKDGNLEYYLDNNNAAVDALRPGQSLSEVFTYESMILNNVAVTGNANVNITITGSNDAPTAVSDSAYTNRNTSVVIDVLKNDTDPEGDAIIIKEFTNAAHGTVSLNLDGTFSYSPFLGFAGTDSFSYVISDGTASDPVKSLATVAIVVGSSDHDQVGGDVFLQGNFMEIGVSSSGSLGTRNAAPAGYHPSDPTGEGRISFVVDEDGWDAGAPPDTGDFTLPGIPADTIVLGIAGESFVQDERVGLRNIDTITTDLSTGAQLKALTAGTINGVEFSQLIELDAGSTYYKTTITLKNTNNTSVNDVVFMRSFDPDQDVFLYDRYETYNDVLSNPIGKNDIATSRAIGLHSGVSVNLVSFDSSARASNYGFFNYDAYDERALTNPVDEDGALDDIAITMAFDIGTMDVGQIVNKVFYTSLNGSKNANDMTLGTTSDDLINSGLGDDIVIGYAGNDDISGNLGNDKFIFTEGSGDDVIRDFTAGRSTDDVIELRGFGFTSFSELRSVLTQTSSGVLINLTAVDSVLLAGVNVTNLSTDDFLFT